MYQFRFSLSICSLVSSHFFVVQDVNKIFGPPGMKTQRLSWLWSMRMWCWLGLVESQEPRRPPWCFSDPTDLLKHMFKKKTGCSRLATNRSDIIWLFNNTYIYINIYCIYIYIHVICIGYWPAQQDNNRIFMTQKRGDVSFTAPGGIHHREEASRCRVNHEKGGWGWVKQG